MCSSDLLAQADHEAPIIRMDQPAGCEIDRQHLSFRSNDPADDPIRAVDIARRFTGLETNRRRAPLRIGLHAWNTKALHSGPDRQSLGSKCTAIDRLLIAQLIEQRLDLVSQHIHLGKLQLHRAGVDGGEVENGIDEVEEIAG